MNANLSNGRPRLRNECESCSSAPVERCGFAIRTIHPSLVSFEIRSFYSVPTIKCVEDHADEVTRLLQGYVDNEVNLNAANDCKLSCTDYQLTTNHLCYNGSYCAENTASAPQTDLKCNGQVVGCDFVGNDMTICPTVSAESVANKRDLY